MRLCDTIPYSRDRVVIRGKTFVQDRDITSGKAGVGIPAAVLYNIL